MSALFGARAALDAAEGLHALLAGAPRGPCRYRRLEHRPGAPKTMMPVARSVTGAEVGRTRGSVVGQRREDQGGEAPRRARAASFHAPRWRCAVGLAH